MLQQLWQLVLEQMLHCLALDAAALQEHRKPTLGLGSEKRVPRRLCFLRMPYCSAPSGPVVISTFSSVALPHCGQNSRLASCRMQDEVQFENPKSRISQAADLTGDLHVPAVAAASVQSKPLVRLRVAA